MAKTFGFTARAFPGSSLVWAASLATIVLGAVLMGRLFLAETASLTGTNSVGIAAVVAHADPGQETCIRDLVVPEATGRIEVWQGLVDVGKQARITAWVENLGTPRISLRYLGSGNNGEFKQYALPAPITTDLQDAKVCIRAQGTALNFGGASVMRLPTAAASSVGASPLRGVDIGIRFQRARGDAPRVLKAIGPAFQRATNFKPAFARVAIYFCALFLVLSIYPIARVAATANRHKVRRLAFGAAALAFVNASAWVFLLQPFHGADESEHFAYAQHLAATGSEPDSSQASPRPPYASSELRLMEAVHHNSTILNSSSRLRWDTYYINEYKQSLESRPSNGDGGGYTESATGHSPLYYGIIGLPYRLLGRPNDLRSAVILMRLFNALMAAAIAALAVLTASHWLPGRNTVAWLAGVLVAMQPVFGSVSAAINNDTAVNLLAATVVFLLIRSWRVGLSWRYATLIGGLAVMLPVAKITGFALIPVIALSVLILALRYGYSAAFRWAGAAALGAGLAAVLWMFVVAPLIGAGRGRILNVHPVAGQAASSMRLASTSPSVADARPLSVSLLGRADYLLQTFVPPARLGPKRWQIDGPTRLSRWPAFAIYIDRGYGLFGWKSTRLPYPLLKVVFLALMLGWVLALVAGVRARALWRHWLGAAMILGATIVAVLAFISYAYTNDQVHTEPGEQGRYLFTAIVPLAVLLSGAVVAFRRKCADIILGVGVAAAWVLALMAWTSALRGWYT